MKVFNVVGITKTGKTTTIEEIIKELKRRRYRVGSVKDIHFEAFQIDTKGTNTDRHKEAGSELVTARGLYETDILFQEQLDIYTIASFYDVDYLVVEGGHNMNVPSIVTGRTENDLDERLNKKTFLISGVIGDSIEEYKGIKVLSALKNIEKIVDKIEGTVFPLLPDYDPSCCQSCGYSCHELCERIVAGKSTFDDCLIKQGDITITINNQKLKMVPFVQKTLIGTIRGAMSQLDGYKTNGAIKIEIKGSNDGIL